MSKTVARLELFWAILSTVVIWLSLVLWVAIFGVAAIDLCQPEYVELRWVRVSFAISIGVSAPILYVRHLLGEKHERDEQKKELREAIETLGKKSKITRKKGQYRARNWAAKWIAYVNGIPTPRPRGNFEMGFPVLPRVNEKRDRAHPNRKPKKQGGVV